MTKYTLEITATGEEVSDLTTALEYIIKSIDNGNTRGMDGGDGRDYTFSITETEEED